MSDDLIKRSDAIKAYNEAMSELVKWQMEEWQLGDFSECEFNTTDCKHIVRKIEAIPSADRPSEMMTQEEAMNMSNEQAVQILIPMRNMMCDQHGCPISDAVFALDKAIEALSADRPQGEWIYGEHNVAMCDGYRCNRCDFFVPWDYEHKSIDFINDYHFCPYCGCRMKGADDE